MHLYPSSYQHRKEYFILFYFQNAIQGIMERSFRMKRIVTGAIALLMACSMAIGQASLLNEATNGLFKNVNDFVIKPNIKFNTVETQQVLIGGGFDNLGFESNATGGGLIGYYHPGSLPWSVAGSLNLNSENHEVSQIVTDRNGQTTSETTHENPAFANYETGFRFNIGLPKTMNLSAGIEAYFKGTEIPQSETTTSANGQDTTTYKGGTKTFEMVLGIPFGMEFGSVYNIFEPFILVHKTTDVIPSPQQNAGGEETTTTNTFMIYDKLIVQDLLPSPFGSETSFWIGIGNAELTKITELEKPAYTATEGGVGEIKFSTQFGMANMLDFSTAGIEIRFKPMVYFDLALGPHKSVTFGTTIAAGAAAYAPLGNLPLAVFFGVTPALQFHITKLVTETTNPAGATTTTTVASRSLRTNVLWSGKVGTSVLLPKDMVLDITLNVNTTETNTSSLGLSAQMSIAL